MVALIPEIEFELMPLYLKYKYINKNINNALYFAVFTI